IVSAAEQMAASAVPAGVVPVTSGGANRQPAPAGLSGQHLYLVLEDGTQLRGYVSDRVDDALDDVRRSKRSGKKG
ncbi:hypothetical protein, partial [Streptomyces scabiei]|uniref:hypothetical protein n=1 Tax=Streptomyces scabiei TaxID=1930 RepID=UPI0029B64F35